MKKKREERRKKREKRKEKKGYRVELCSVVRSDYLVLLFSFFIFLSSFSCDLFQPADPDYIKKLDEEVAWANAAKLSVTVVYPQEWGSSPQAGTGRCFDAKRTRENPRQGYAFDLQFDSSSSYGEANWVAYKTSDLPEGTNWYLNLISISDAIHGKNALDFDKEEVIFTPRTGGRTQAVINIKEDVTIIPWCDLQPRIVRSVPSINSKAEEGSTHIANKDITITFASPIDKDTLKFAEGYIEIDGLDVSTYYNTPFYDDETYTLSIQSKGNIPAGAAVTVKLGSGIKSVGGEKGMEPVEFSFLTKAATKYVESWTADYDVTEKNKITVTWMPSSGAAGSPATIRYREGNESLKPLNNVTGNVLIIDNISKIDTSGVTDGIAPSGFIGYTIYIDYEETDTTIRIWNVPGMSVSSEQGAGNSIVELNRANFMTELKADNRTYVLTQDVALDDWVSVSNFQGKFYGNGHTVTINSFSNASGSGFIGVMEGGLVRDLTVSYPPYSGITTSAAIFGGIASQAHTNARFENVRVLGAVTTNLTVLSTTQNIGGIAGRLGQTGNRSTIKNAYSGITFTVDGYSGMVGGIVGYSYNSDIEYCVFNGTIRSGDSLEYIGTAGGIIGTNRNDVSGNYKMSNCIARGNIHIIASSSIPTTGGLIGNLTTNTISGVDGSIFTIEDSFFEAGNIALKSSSSGGVAGGFVGSMPQVSTGTRYIIRNSGVLGGTLTVEGISSVTAGGFSSTIQGDISNCFSKMDIIVNTIYIAYVGGFTGELARSSSTMSGCYAAGSVRVVQSGTIQGNDSVSVGGLVGRLHGKIENCYALGDVLVDRQSGYGSMIIGFTNAGGLVGQMYDTFGSSIINNCFSTGQVTVQSRDNEAYGGGIAGYRYAGTISNTVALGSKVTAASGPSVQEASAAGRIVGATRNTSGLTNNYAINSMQTGAGVAYNTVVPVSVPDTYNTQTERNGETIGIGHTLSTSFWGTDIGFSSARILKPDADPNSTNPDDYYSPWDLSGGTIAGRGHPLLLNPPDPVNNDKQTLMRGQ